MKDIKDTLQANKDVQYINLSAGNPLIIPDVDKIWRKHTNSILDTTFSDVIGRYGSSQGYEPLINAIVEFFNTTYNWGITNKNILVTSGSQSLYFIATNAFCGTDINSDNRHVLLPITPDYTGYGGVVVDSNMIVSNVPRIEKKEKHRFKYHVNFESLRINESVGAIILSRPSNPSGNIISKDELNKIIDAASSFKIPVLVDSAYASPFPNLVYTNMEHVWKENVIHCLSFSKAGLPGERIGIAIGHESYIEVMEAFQSNLNLHSSRFGQALVAETIISGDMDVLSKETIQPYYLEKKKILEDALDKEMPDIPWYLHDIEGGLFGWLWIENLPISDLELYDLLKKEGLLIVPGSSFFPSTDKSWVHSSECIRISLTASNEEILLAAKIISKTLVRIFNANE